MLGGGVLSAFGSVLGLMFMRRVFRGDSETDDDVEDLEQEENFDEATEGDEDPDEDW